MPFMREIMVTGKEISHISYTTDCVVGMNTYFTDNIERNYKVRSYEYFNTPNMFLESNTFKAAILLEINYAIQVSIIDFASTLFV